MRVLHNESLLHRNTLALKSRASAYVEVSSEQELIEALEWATNHHMSIVTLGQGSNVVLAGDLDALIIHQNGRGIEVLEENDEGVVVKVAAGESWHQLVEWSLGQGYYGLENLALIPGTVGAAPIQNIGAYGVELASFIRSVSAVRVSDSKALVLSDEACEFAYRDSIFKNALRDQVIITSVELSLSKRPRLQLSYPALRNYLDDNACEELTPRTIFDAVVDIRKSRLPDPADLPNAGSFFKNPVVTQSHLNELLGLVPDLPRYPQPDGQVKLPAAWLIDQCGWKGKRAGSFGVHPQHALVLVNYEGDDGRALLALAGQIQQSVFDAYRIDLEIEPRVYGGG
ncbi:MAG: UDP-N-acetylmuramate dehydrogenase [Proteobacteria bacterium]|nr:UDP-N-acetylmuramate dehydrogenase [Pseudomonadota bacterium]